MVCSSDTPVSVSQNWLKGSDTFTSADSEELVFDLFLPGLVDRDSWIDWEGLIPTRPYRS